MRREKIAAALIALLVAGSITTLLPRPGATSNKGRVWARGPRPSESGAHFNVTAGNRLGYRTTVFVNGSRYSVSLVFYNITEVGEFDTPAGERLGVNLTDIRYNATNSRWEQLIPYNNSHLDGYLTNRTSHLNALYSTEGEGAFNASLQGAWATNPEGVPLLAPVNGTEGPMVEWCAARLNGSGDQVEANFTPPNNLSMRAPNSNGSYTLTALYLPNGTAEKVRCEIYWDNGWNVTFLLERIYDFKPLDNTGWTVEEGDAMYFSSPEGPIWVNVSGISRGNLGGWGTPPRHAPESSVWANVWRWDDSSWASIGVGAVGAANDYYPVEERGALSGRLLRLPLLLPEGATGDGLRDGLDLYARPGRKGLNTAAGDLWLEVANRSSGGSVLAEYAPDGTLARFSAEGAAPAELLPLVEAETPPRLRRLAAKRVSGSDDLPVWDHGCPAVFEPLATTDASGVLFLAAALAENPEEVSLNASFAFLDLFAERPEGIEGLEVEAKYNRTRWGAASVWRFNASGSEWAPVESEDLGNGSVFFSGGEGGTYALTAAEGAQDPPSGDGEGEDPGDGGSGDGEGENPGDGGSGDEGGEDPDRIPSALIAAAGIGAILALGAAAVLLIWRGATSQTVPREAARREPGAAGEDPARPTGDAGSA
jgi:hypothetical protein